MRRTIPELLSSLRPLDQEIIVLRHFDELSNAAAAEALGISPVAAGKLYVRAITRLTKLIRQRQYFHPFSNGRYGADSRMA